jgi:hypothetical protein
MPKERLIFQRVKNEISGRFTKGRSTTATTASLKVSKKKAGKWASAVLATTKFTPQRKVTSIAKNTCIGERIISLSSRYDSECRAGVLRFRV